MTDPKTTLDNRLALGEITPQEYDVLLARISAAPAKPIAPVEHGPAPEPPNAHPPESVRAAPAHAVTSDGPPPLPSAETNRLDLADAPSTRQSYYRRGSLGGLANTATILLIGDIVAGLATALSQFGQIGVLDDIDRGSITGQAALDAASSADGLYAAFNGIYLLVSLASTITVMIWTYSAMRNLHAFGAAVTISPGWAIGWYFVPVANLWKPLEAMTQIFRNSRLPEAPHAAHTGGLLGWWWTSFIIAIIFVPIVISAKANAGSEISDLQGMLALDAIAVVPESVSILLLLFIIRAVTRDQSYNKISID